MGLKKFLNAGNSVIGSKYDGNVKPLSEMSEAAQKRNGYTDANGYFTELGYDRMTSVDDKKLRAGWKARLRSGE